MIRDHIGSQAPPSLHVLLTDRLTPPMTLLPRPISLRVCAGLLMLSGLLTGCGTSVMNMLQPYRMEVVQGNVVTQDMVEKLRPGQTRDQVRNLLGAPVLNDIFHATRWDYVFTIRRQGAEPQQRRVTVFFDGDRVKSFEAGQVPTEREFVASIDAAKPQRGLDSLELTEAQLKALPLPTSSGVSAPAPAASGPLRNYPPLEAISR
jgi:outer membrane protein assembly factor BamE